MRDILCTTENYALLSSYIMEGIKKSCTWEEDLLMEKENTDIVSVSFVLQASSNIANKVNDAQLVIKIGYLKAFEIRSLLNLLSL